MKEHVVRTIRALVEADNKLRDIERQWSSTGSLEDEYAYHREHLKTEGYVELTKLSVEFTRWKEAREWFRDIHAGGSASRMMRLNGTPIRQVMPVVERTLRERLRENGFIFVAAIGWRAYQAPGFSIDFTFQRDRDDEPSEMCASLWARGTQIDLQSLNRNCPFRDSYGLYGNQSSIHRDTIMLATSTGHRSAWDLHIRAGK